MNMHVFIYSKVYIVFTLHNMQYKMYKNVQYGTKIRIYAHFCTDMYNLTFAYYKYFYMYITICKYMLNCI